MGLLAVLFLIFLVLKLTGLVAWSWVLVLAPLWLELLVDAVVFTLCGSFVVDVYRRVSGKVRR